MPRQMVFVLNDAILKLSGVCRGPSDLPDHPNLKRSSR